MNTGKGLPRAEQGWERRQAKIQFQIKSQLILQEELLRVNYTLEFVLTQGMGIRLSRYQISRSLDNIQEQRTRKLRFRGNVLTQGVRKGVQVERSIKKQEHLLFINTVTTLSDQNKYHQ